MRSPQLDEHRHRARLHVRIFVGTDPSADPVDRGGLQPKTTKPVSAGTADAKGSIEGTVTNASGVPVKDAKVTIDGHEGFKALTDVAGRYLLSGVPPGDYTVMATVSDATRRVRVTVGAGEKATTNIRL